MTSRCCRIAGLAAAFLLVMPAAADLPKASKLEWATVVNNNDLMPPHYAVHFNSYNPPSVNALGVVVIRARSRGGPPFGPPVHGIYLRDMSAPDSAALAILDRTTQVPLPNNLGATYTETPAFPRIDIDSPAIATRGNHQPVYRYQLADGSETRIGSTGIYANPFGALVTAAANMGNVDELARFQVPEFAGVRFEVFPGAPAITDGDTIVFKGNYTVDGRAGTGVYFRKLVSGESGGDHPAILIANNTNTLMPGTAVVFGTVAPPGAAAEFAVFAGFDDESAPERGGIYLAPLQFDPPLTTLVSIGQRVPGATRNATFTNLGEAVSFDGRYVGFWGSWGEDMRTQRLYCPEEGNKDRIAFCNQALVCSTSGEVLGDPDSVCDDPASGYQGRRCYTEKQVPANQGVFVHDTRTGNTQLVAKSGSEYDDFLFWNYSGKAPCASAGGDAHGGEDDAEAARWRSSAFISVSQARKGFAAAFKARRGKPGRQVDGIYLVMQPEDSPVLTVLETSMDGLRLDAEAPIDSTIVEVGLEREGLRGDWLTVTAVMETEGSDVDGDGMAGVYVARLR